VRGRETRLGITFVVLNLIGGAEFFQKPQNPLRTGVIERMDEDHRSLLLGSRSFDLGFSLAACHR
jgi:hypothetical protein